MSSSTYQNQASNAEQLYDDRSSTYDNSWHPRFARHLVELAHLQSGEHVLDLACGTGLASFAASEAVGTSGYVVGVDISTGMLEQAENKQLHHPIKNVVFCRHSITDLANLDFVHIKQFDVITCASALVLLEHPSQALSEWVHYLKPGGRLIVDVTHPRSQIAGITMERVGRALGKPVPYYRSSFCEPRDLGILMELAGLQSVDVKAVSQMTILGTNDLEDYITDADRPKQIKEYHVNDAESIFENVISGKAFEDLAQAGIREQANQLFTQEWRKLADKNGLIQEVDCVFVGIGTKPPTPSSN